MKINYKLLLIASLFSPIIHATNTNSPCDTKQTKEAIHCDYIVSTATKTSGKFLKIKSIRPNHSAITTILCAGAVNQPIMNIPQNQSNFYHSGNNINWQFSQCIDEDCSASKILADDKFTITKVGKLYGSISKNKVEIALDPDYGINCKPDHLQNDDSALDMSINDATAMIKAIPIALNETLTILNKMNTIATDAASGVYSPTQLGSMNAKFQVLKEEIDKVQRVNTLDGYKNISGGTVTIQIGDPQNSTYSQLQIGIPETDQGESGLNIASLDVLTMEDAQNAITLLRTAIETVMTGMSMTNNMQK